MEPGKHLSWPSKENIGDYCQTVDYAIPVFSVKQKATYQKVHKPWLFCHQEQAICER
jgi:hypothetical protein